MRFSRAQYENAIDALRDAMEQLKPDGRCCVICHDSGHQAWECGHNPLVAMAICEAIAKSSGELHDQLHAIEDRMDSENVDDELAGWREDAHEHLHMLAGHNSHMGVGIGPARVVLPDGER